MKRSVAVEMQRVEDPAATPSAAEATGAYVSPGNHHPRVIEIVIASYQETVFAFWCLKIERIVGVLNANGNGLYSLTSARPFSKQNGGEFFLLFKDTSVATRERVLRIA